MNTPRFKYQREQVEKYRGDGKVVNLACKEDPAKLGRDFGAVNVDVLEYDVQTNTNLVRDVVNFHRLDIQDLPEEWTNAFSVAVLGDVLEHCIEDAALRILMEARRVAEYIVITLPFDTRTPEEQHAAEANFKVSEGCYSYHVRDWKLDIKSLLGRCNLDIIDYQDAEYPHCGGAFITVRRREPITA
jgi:hypothetical protein